MSRADHLSASLFNEGLAALARGDNHAARDSFDRAALTAATEPALSDRRAHCLTNCAHAAAALGDHTGALAMLAIALDLCDRSTGDALAGLRVIVLLGQAPALMATGDYDAAGVALDRALAILDGEAPVADDEQRVELRISALMSLTMLASYREDWARANELGTRCLAVVTAQRPHFAGVALMNLADIALHTGRVELAVDFGVQALASFEEYGDTAGAAGMRRSLGQMYLRSGRLDEAEPVLTAAHAYFEAAGMLHQAAAGLDMLGLLAAAGGDMPNAGARFAASAELFERLGQPVEAAEARGRQGVVVYFAGDRAGGEALLAATAATQTAHGLPIRAAQIHVIMATLFEQENDAAMLARAADLAVPAALAVDAVARTLASGRQRDQWRRNVAEPALWLAFRVAARSGNGPLVAQLVESRCAGSTLEHRVEAEEPPQGMEALMYPPEVPVSIGTALAEAAAGPGLALALPPRLALTPHGGVALDVHLTRAAERYGMPVRAEGTIPSW
ncbi:tetratricopeptide repeat protein [Phytomonospora sp. NPDC050363]|uniref:tetratricopeptide repeat protein n=1 Tax=Phytomonospora sp. NPDC050363 TaxID=3155642 RepID=UPI00340A6409